MKIFPPSLVVFALVLVDTCILRAQVLFYPSEEYNDYYLKQDDLPLIYGEGKVTCPETCPNERVPICASNGFCIQLFDSPCLLVLFNRNNNEEYKQVHERYCDIEKYGSLQPIVCRNSSLSELPNSLQPDDQ